MVGQTHTCFGQFIYVRCLDCLLPITAQIAIAEIVGEEDDHVGTLGGIHGDELSSVSIVFGWLDSLDKYRSGLFHWRIAPLINPDGLQKPFTAQLDFHVRFTIRPIKLYLPLPSIRLAIEPAISGNAIR